MFNFKKKTAADDDSRKKQTPDRYPDNDDMMIISENTRWPLNTKKTRKNNNVLLIGGNEKTQQESFICPNIKRGNSNFIITDPDGEILSKCRTDLEKKGYTIKTIVFTDTLGSDWYDPIANIRETRDIWLLANMMAGMSSPEGEEYRDPFWNNAEKLYLYLAMLYIWKRYPKDKQNVKNLYDILNKDCDELQKLFDDISETESDDALVKQFKTLKIADKETMGRISRYTLSDMSSAVIEHSLQEPGDTLDLDSFDEKDNAIFLITGDDENSRVKNLTELLYAQLCMKLYSSAGSADGSLKHRTVFYLSERADMDRNDVEAKLATMRSRNMSAVISIKTIGQFNRIYRSQHLLGGVAGNCDTKIYFGADMDTDEWFSQLCGKLTAKNTKGEIIALPVITAEELKGLLYNDECVVRVRGYSLVIDKRYKNEVKKDKFFILPIEDDRNDNINILVLGRSSGEEKVPFNAPAPEEKSDKGSGKEAAEQYDEKQEEMKKKGYGNYGGSDYKSYTVNEALKLIKIKEDCIEKLKAQIKKGSTLYLPLSEAEDAIPRTETERMRAKYQEQKDRFDKSREISKKIFLISQENEAIADIKRQIRHYDAETVPEEMKTWGTTIEELKDGLPALRAQKDFLQELVSEALEEQRIDDGKIYVKKTLYDIKELEHDLYALTFKIAYWEESIEETYTSEEAINVKGEIYI